jgi:hypothetical protein
VLRQVGILVVSPAPAATPWIEQVLSYDPPCRVISEVGLLTLAMDLPCRRSAPVLQRLWLETIDTPEREMIENLLARLNALVRVGPATIVTLGPRAEWSAIRLGCLRAGVDMGEFADIRSAMGPLVGIGKAELVDLTEWLKIDSLRSGFAGRQSEILKDKEEQLARKTLELYRVFLRSLFATGRISRPVYNKCEKSIFVDFKELAGNVKKRQ